MTKGEIPSGISESCEPLSNKAGTLSEFPKPDFLEGKQLAECSSSAYMLNSFVNQINICDINIADYVQNLPDFVRNKIAGFVGTGSIDEDLIDIENIIHYLIVSRHSNPLKSACESKLLSTLSSANCGDYLKIAERFDLESLRKCSQQVYENNYINTYHPQKIPTEIRTQRRVQHSSFRNYRNIFTCETTSAKRVVSVVVMDSTNEVKCYRNIKKGDKISKQFQCCCIQDDEECPPYVYWSFGKCFCRYDPILNKCKKLKPLRHKRSNFCLLAHSQRCYAIGGMCKGETVRQIEEYDIKLKRWRTVSKLPIDCHMSYSSCVLFQDLIYIFCAATSRENCSLNRTIVCVFDPVTRTVNVQSEIPMTFNQILSCTVDSEIYLASDDGDFIRYTPSTGAFITCREQLLKCKDFGMYNENGNILLVGGINGDGKTNNSIRKYCTVSGRWERLYEKLPECMAVYGTCEVKIPRTCAIVPFYETKVFEIPPK